MSVPIVRTLAELRATVAGWRREGAAIAVVPTMGALHEGHLSLVRAALDRADRVIVTLFVNPKQFNSAADLAAYPRTEDDDAAKLAPLGAHMLYAPDAEEIYPDGFATTVSVSGVSEGLCGAFRPGHFDGVATVVAKLFLQTGADLAFFGEKDFQQLLVVHRMARDLDIPIEIIGCPTVREADGLALSSRNVRLSPAERAKAPKLAEALVGAARRLASGAPVAATLDEARAAILAAGFDRVEYLELRAADDLAPLDALERPARLLVAAWLGETRLIDNLEVGGPVGKGGAELSGNPLHPTAPASGSGGSPFDVPGAGRSGRGDRGAGEPDLVEGRDGGVVGRPLAPQPERAHAARGSARGKLGPLGGLGSADAGDEPRAHEGLDREALAQARDQQGEADAAGRTPRKDQAAAAPQRLEPFRRRRDDAGIDIDDVGLRQPEPDRIAFYQLDIGEAAQVGPGARRQRGFDLVGDHPAAGLDQARQDRGIIAGAGADMDRRLARLRRHLGEPHGMQQGLAVVALVVQRHQRIAVEVVRVGGGRGDAVAVHHDRPGAGADEILARDRGEGILDARIPGVRAGGQEPGIVAAQVRKIDHAT